MDGASVEREAIREQLGRVLSSVVFRRAERSSALLKFIVEQTLDGRSERLKEYTLGAEALGRGEIVRSPDGPCRASGGVEAASPTRAVLRDHRARRPGCPPSAERQLRPAVRAAPLDEPDPSASAEPPERCPRGFRFVTNPWVAWCCAVVALAIGGCSVDSCPSVEWKPTAFAPIRGRVEVRWRAGVRRGKRVGPLAGRHARRVRFANGRWPHAPEYAASRSAKRDPAARYRRRSWAVRLARRPVGWDSGPTAS